MTKWDWIKYWILLSVFVSMIGMGIFLILWGGYFSNNKRYNINGGRHDNACYLRT